MTCYAADLAHDVVKLAGLPVTSPLRTAMDIARSAPRWVALPMLDVAAAKGLFSPVQALVRLDDLPYERGVGIARRTAGLVDAGAESAMESVTRVRLDDAGFPRPETQILVPRPGCLPYRLDLGWRSSTTGSAAVPGEPGVDDLPPALRPRARPKTRSGARCR